VYQDVFLRDLVVKLTLMSDELEEQLKALSQIEELRKEFDGIIALRTSNSPLNAEKSRKNINKANLKSDLKKTTAFVKKIRAITSEGILQCIRDVQTLNLTLYISEIVAAIAETNFKATDVPNIVKLCIELHLRYEDFTYPLVNALKESLSTHSDEEEGKKKRIQMRLIMELFQVGIFIEENFFSQLLKDLTGKSQTRYICSHFFFSLYVSMSVSVLGVNQPSILPAW
jgi:hypothetical protein